MEELKKKFEYIFCDLLFIYTLPSQFYWLEIETSSVTFDLPNRLLNEFDFHYGALFWIVFLETVFVLIVILFSL